MPGNARPPGPLGLSLGRWAGVPIVADWSAAATLVLFAWLLAASVLPTIRPGRSGLEYWLIGTATAVVFLAMLLAHELAHAVTARHFGMHVRKISLWMLGGVTELDGEPPNPRADALIALAGPLTSLILGAACVGLAASTGGMLAGAVSWLAAVNIIVAVFNLLPAAPLDGGRVLRAVVWRRSGWVQANASAAKAGQVVGVVLVGLGVIELLLGGLAGLWLAMVGWFVLANAAAESYTTTVRLVGGLTLADVMTPVGVTLPDWWTVQRALDELAEHPNTPLVPVVNFAGSGTGLIPVADLGRVVRRDRESTRVRDLRCRRVAAGLPPNTQVSDAMRYLAVGAVVVVDQLRPVGIVTRDGLWRRLRALESRRRAPASAISTA